MVSSPAPLPTINTSSTVDLTAQLEEALPKPETFDILPALHELLSRLIPQSEDISRPATYSKQQSLAPQQLQAEASVIRSKIRRAREAVAALPDIDRSIAQQEEEIKELRAQIERQRRVLQRLAGG